MQITKVFSQVFSLEESPVNGGKTQAKEGFIKPPFEGDDEVQMSSLEFWEKFLADAFSWTTSQEIQEEIALL